MKTVNLRDGIWDLEGIIDDETKYGQPIHAEDVKRAVDLLKKCQNVLIKLEDEDWDKLDLDVEFIL